MKKIIAIFILLSSTQKILAQNCDTKFKPVVFVHGMLASGDTYATQVQRFIAQGYCSSSLVAMDWNTVGLGRNNTAMQLDAIINKVLEKTGAKQVELVGHSAGGGVCYNYLKDSAKAQKVAHYVHVGSSKLTEPAMVPTMNVYSKDDLISGGVDVAGATNIALPGKDHYEVATSEETFKAMFQFFNQLEPKLTNAKQKTKEPIDVSGRAVTLGDNKPLANATIQVYRYDATKGKRIDVQPYQTMITDTAGFWKGLSFGNSNTATEFVLIPDTTTKMRTIHYYFEPFTNNNPMLYLRGLPNTGMAGMMLRVLPKDTIQSALAIFSANKAVIHGKDSLTVNNINLSSAELSPASKTAIAHFLMDDGDKQTSGNPLFVFKQFPFMNGVDVFLPAGNKNITIYFNGRTMSLPSRKSSDGVMVAVFN